MKMKLEDTYDYAREIRGLAEVLFLANNSPDSIAVHSDDAMRVLCELCDQLVNEIESLMNQQEDIKEREA